MPPKVRVKNRLAILRREYEHRTGERMALVDLATKLSISRQYLSKIEHQKASISPEIEAKIISIFGIKSMDELYSIEVVDESGGNWEPTHTLDAIA